MKNYLSQYSAELEATLRTLSVLIIAMLSGGIFAFVIERFGLEALILGVLCLSGVYLIWLTYSVHLNQIRTERKIAALRERDLNSTEK